MLSTARLSTADEAYAAAMLHAATCPRCSQPIVDEEGNPGYFGEACPAGRDILAAYCRAIGEHVPACYGGR